MGRISLWIGEAKGYWREAIGLRDFAGVMQVRLSQSKLGPWIAPNATVVDVNLRSLGPKVRLRSHTTDISVLGELLFGDSLAHLPHEASVNTVVDLGANVGLAYRWLRERYPGAHFVCVEPHAGNLESLYANTSDPTGRVDVIAACIGARRRRVRLASTSGEWGFRMVDVDATDADTDVVTMDDILSRTGIRRISLLKCDIEGAEAELFSDCRTWIDRVDNIVVECHSDVVSVDALIGLLEQNGAGFAIRHIDRKPDRGFEMATLRRLAANAGR